MVPSVFGVMSNHVGTPTGTDVRRLPRLPDAFSSASRSGAPIVTLFAVILPWGASYATLLRTKHGDLAARPPPFLPPGTRGVLVPRAWRSRPGDGRWGRLTVTQATRKSISGWIHCKPGIEKAHFPGKMPGFRVQDPDLATPPGDPPPGAPLGPPWGPPPGDPPRTPPWGPPPGGAPRGPPGAQKWPKSRTCPYRPLINCKIGRMPTKTLGGPSPIFQSFAFFSVTFRADRAKIGQK